MAKVWSDYTVEELMAMTSEELVAVPYEMQAPWKDDVDDYTPITPDRLNRMEAGIKRANDAWDSKSQRREIELNYSLPANASEYILIPDIDGCLCKSCCLLLDVRSDGSPRVSAPMRQPSGKWNTRITTGGACTIKGRLVCFYEPA